MSVYAVANRKAFPDVIDSYALLLYRRRSWWQRSVLRWSPSPSAESSRTPQMCSCSAVFIRQPAV